MPKKSRLKSRKGVKQPHGGVLIPGAGRGPAKGAPNAGRPPDEFKALCRELATAENTIKAVRAILKDKKHAQFIPALRWASEHGYGKPTQPLEHGVTDSLAALIRGGPSV